MVGPLFWEPPYEDVEPPPGDDPLVLVAPSTAQDPEHRLLRAAVGGLGSEPVRVLASWNRRPLGAPVYAAPQHAAGRVGLVLAHDAALRARDLPRGARDAGAGARVGLSGASRCLDSGDMAENAARTDWAGVGVRLPWRLLAPATLRLAVRRALADAGLAERAGRLGAWASAHDGAARAADLVERLALSRAGGS